MPEENPLPLQNPASQETEAPKEEPKTPTRPKGAWLKERPSLTCQIYIYLTKEGEFAMVLPSKLDNERRDLLELIEQEIKAEFTIPKKKQLDGYKVKSSTWSEPAQQVVYNRMEIRNLLIRYHLVSLSIPDPENPENDLVLERDPKKNNRLTQATEEKLEGLHPSILETLVNKFTNTADLMF